MFLFAVSANKEQYFAKSQNKHSHQIFQQMVVISVNYAAANGGRFRNNSGIKDEICTCYSATI